MSAKKKSESFEEILENLESIIRDLEGGDLPLEKALERFEQGVALSRRGAKRLQDVEKRIEEVLADGSTNPLDIEPGDQESAG